MKLKSAHMQLSLQTQTQAIYLALSAVLPLPVSPLCLQPRKAALVPRLPLVSIGPHTSFFSLSLSLCVRENLFAQACES